HADAVLVEACLANLRPVTRFTITDPAAMRRELAAVRRTGYARSREEMTLGTAALAVPVVDPGGHVIAALGLVTRTVRPDLGKLLPALRMAAASISRGRASGGPARV